MTYSPFRTPNLHLDPRIAAMMPDPRSINMVPQAPQGPVKQPGLLSRIGSGMANRFMPAPAGGLLSEQDIKNARAQGLLGLGASLLASGGRRADQGGTLANLGAAIQQGQGAYQGAVDQSMDRQMAAQQMQAQKAGIVQGEDELRRKTVLDKQRQSIIAAHPLPKDAGGMSAWIEAVLPKFMAAGDEEYVQRLAAIRSTLGNGQQQEEGTYVTTPGPDGRPMRRWVSQAEAAKGVPEYERPQRDTDDALTLNSQILRGQGEEKWFQEQTKGVQSTVDAYMAAIPAAKMKGTGDLQVLYSFIRALDPGSVVREGEVALASQAAPLRARAEILAQKIVSGEGGTLSEVQRQQMIQLMKQMVDLKVERTRTAYTSSMGRIKQYGLPATLYNPLEAYDAFVRQQQAPQDQMNDFGVISGGSSTAPAAAGSDLRSRYGGLR